MAGIGRWGWGGDLDFWTALDLGEVNAAEIRAVDLLLRTTDPERFAYYCQTGMLPVLGNLTGRTYLLLRGGAAIELEDGQAIASWCISIGPHRSDIPGTDHVVVLRNFVEGEELVFLETGNRSTFSLQHLMDRYNFGDWLPDPFLSPIGESSESENDEILELEELKSGLGLAPLRMENYVGHFAAVDQNDVNDDMGGALRAGVARYVQRFPQNVNCRRPVPLAQIIPNLPPGLGVDLPDGRVLHLDEDLERQLRLERGIEARDEVERMIEEGYEPEMIEHAMNDVLWR